MPTVSGTLSDIGLAPLTGLQPQLHFTPSSPAVALTGRVFATKPVVVTPATNGSFSVDLASTEGLVPVGTHWQVAVKFLLPSADGRGHSPSDYLPLKLFVPADGGVIGDLIGEHTPNDLVYVGTDVPNPAKSTYQFQFNPLTGDLYGRQV